LEDFHFWHGVLVPEFVVERPESITLRHIEEEANVEVRRVLIERYGQARFLADGGAKELHRDDFGVLFAKEIPGDEPLVMVNVVNSTPEANGDFHDYFMRVPPSMRTAREAVARTFGKTANLYSPTKET